LNSMSKRDSSKEIASDPASPYIVFKLGGEEYGIRIEQVKEVTITSVITRMPKTPEFIKGVANIRGDIVAIMDLEERFNIKPAEPANDHKKRNNTYTLVVERDNYTIGLIVKEVPQTLNLAQSDIDRTPGFFSESNIQQRYIEGIAKVEGRLIIIFDLNKILTLQEEQLLMSEEINENLNLENHG
jgi:purine-binding chemotaxis protein CheW